MKLRGYMNLRNWEQGRAVSFLGIFVFDVFAVRSAGTGKLYPRHRGEDRVRERKSYPATKLSSRTSVIVEGGMLDRNKTTEKTLGLFFYSIRVIHYTPLRRVEFMSSYTS
jgi:hypothetical protein